MRLAKEDQERETGQDRRHEEGEEDHQLQELARAAAGAVVVEREQGPEDQRERDRGGAHEERVAERLDDALIVQQEPVGLEGEAVPQDLAAAHLDEGEQDRDEQGAVECQQHDQGDPDQDETRRPAKRRHRTGAGGRPMRAASAMAASTASRRKTESAAPNGQLKAIPNWL